MEEVAEGSFKTDERELGAPTGLPPVEALPGGPRSQL